MPASVVLPLRRLHLEQQETTFSQLVLPLRARGAPLTWRPSLLLALHRQRKNRRKAEKAKEAAAFRDQEQQERLKAAGRLRGA